MAKVNFQDLQRREPFRDANRRFILFCEGKKTEPSYFRGLQRLVRHALVHLEIVPAVGVAYTVAEKAVEFANQADASKKAGPEGDSYEEHDQIWAVFDRDDHPRFDEAVRLCETYGVRVARSNPCFEVWLILHYEDFNKLLDRRKVQQHFQKLHPKYDCDGGKEVDAQAILRHIDKAERLAARQLKQRTNERKPFGSPSTTVHLLTKAIRENEAKTK